MFILLLGKNGQLGWELCRALSGAGRVLALDHPEIDFTRPALLRSLVVENKPDVIINAAGYTDVDRAESEPELANLINAITPGELAEAARATGALLVHYSTDYVFDGTKGTPYVETDEPNPLNVYSESKLRGERSVQQAGGQYLIFRTSGLYSLRRSNFLLKIIHWAHSYEVMRVVDDQVINPTAAGDLANITARCLEGAASAGPAWLNAPSGVYHLGGEGWASRYEWAKTILELFPYPEELKVRQLVPVTSGAFPTPARRPLNTSMSCDLFYARFGLRLPPWREAVRQTLASFPSQKSSEN